MYDKPKREHLIGPKLSHSNSGNAPNCYLLLKYYPNIPKYYNSNTSSADIRYHILLSSKAL